MTPSRCRAPLQGAATQSVAKRGITVGLIRSANRSQKISCSNSSISTEVNNSALLSISCNIVIFAPAYGTLVIPCKSRSTSKLLAGLL